MARDSEHDLTGRGDSSQKKANLFCSPDGFWDFEGSGLVVVFFVCVSFISLARFLL